MLYQPAGQDTHVPFPSDGWTNPLGQSTQTELPFSFSYFSLQLLYLLHIGSFSQPGRQMLAQGAVGHNVGHQ